MSHQYDRSVIVYLSVVALYSLAITTGGQSTPAQLLPASNTAPALGLAPPHQSYADGLFQSTGSAAQPQSIAVQPIPGPAAVNTGVPIVEAANGNTPSPNMAPYSGQVPVGQYSQQVGNPSYPVFRSNPAPLSPSNPPSVQTPMSFNGQLGVPGYTPTAVGFVPIAPSTQNIPSSDPYLTGIPMAQSAQGFPSNPSSMSVPAVPPNQDGTRYQPSSYTTPISPYNQQMPSGSMGPLIQNSNPSPISNPMGSSLNQQVPAGPSPGSTYPQTPQGVALNLVVNAGPANPTASLAPVQYQTLPPLYNPGPGTGQQQAGGAIIGQQQAGGAVIGQQSPSPPASDKDERDKRDNRYRNGNDDDEDRYRKRRDWDDEDGDRRREDDRDDDDRRRRDDRDGDRGNRDRSDDRDRDDRRKDDGSRSGKTGNNDKGKSGSASLSLPSLPNTPNIPKVPTLAPLDSNSQLTSEPSTPPPTPPPTTKPASTIPPMRPGSSPTMSPAPTNASAIEMGTAGSSVISPSQQPQSEPIQSDPQPAQPVQLNTSDPVRSDHPLPDPPSTKLPQEPIPPPSSPQDHPLPAPAPEYSAPAAEPPQTSDVSRAQSEEAPTHQPSHNEQAMPKPTTEPSPQPTTAPVGNMATVTLAPLSLPQAAGKWTAPLPKEGLKIGAGKPAPPLTKSLPVLPNMPADMAKFHQRPDAVKKPPQLPPNMAQPVVNKPGVVGPDRKQPGSLPNIQVEGGNVSEPVSPSPLTPGSGEPLVTPTSSPVLAAPEPGPEPQSLGPSPKPTKVSENPVAAKESNHPYVEPDPVPPIVVADDKATLSDNETGDASRDKISKNAKWMFGKDSKYNYVPSGGEKGSESHSSAAQPDKKNAVKKNAGKKKQERGKDKSGSGSKKPKSSKSSSGPDSNKAVSDIFSNVMNRIKFK